MNKKRLSENFRYMPALLILIVGSGCGAGGTDLDRDTAAEILIANGGYPQEILGDLEMQSEGAQRIADEWGRYQRVMVELNGSGLATTALHTFNVQSTPYDYYVVELTDLGKSFSRGDIEVEHYKNGYGQVLTNLGVGGVRNKSVKVVVQVLDFSEVTGISYLDEGKSTALVEYTEAYSPTPFGELKEALPIKQPDTTTTKKATLRLYDDGWRVID